MGAYETTVLDCSHGEPHKQSFVQSSYLQRILKDKVALSKHLLTQTAIISYDIAFMTYDL